MADVPVTLQSPLSGAIPQHMVSPVVQHVNVDHVHFSSKDVARIVTWVVGMLAILLGSYFTLKAHAGDMLLHTNPQKRSDLGDVVYEKNLDTMKEDIRTVASQQKKMMKALKDMQISCVRGQHQQLECRFSIPLSTEVE